MRFPAAETASAAWQEIDRRFPFIYDAMHYHLISSAGSGVLTPTLLGVMAGGTDASEADHATVDNLYRNPKGDWVKTRGLLFFLPDNASFAEVPGLEREIDAVIEVLRTSMLDIGASVEQLEHRVAALDRCRQGLGGAGESDLIGRSGKKVFKVHVSDNNS